MQNRLIAQGYDCCWNGAVQELTRSGAATYQARITIEENYAVTLKLDAAVQFFGPIANAPVPIVPAANI